MNKVIEFLDGKKTYFGVAAALVYSALIYFGIVANNEVIWTAILSWTGVSLRLAIKKAEL